MKLIFIYGPPAVGKLTVAKELSKLTGYKIFHNHLTLDLLDSVIPFGSQNYFELNSKLRILLFKAAAKDGTNLIFTFCYSNPEDNLFIKKCIRSLRKYNGKIYFVQIFCKEEELYRRVKNKSRKRFNKLKNIRDLKMALEKWNMFSKIPFVKSLCIDNTTISKEKAAWIIKKHYKLNNIKTRSSNNIRRPFHIG